MKFHLAVHYNYSYYSYFFDTPFLLNIIYNYIYIN